MHRFASIVLPFLTWWPDVTRTTLRADLAAGITGAVVVLPQGVAFATIAGMPPEYGLYAAMVPAIIAALFGSSRLLVSGPTTAASIVLLSSLSALAEPGTADYVRYALTLTFMVGLLQLGLGLARLGTLVNFISHSVVVGFTAGAALLIAASQVRHFFGIEMEAGHQVHGVVMEVASRIREIDPFTTGVGIVTLLAAVVVRRIWPRVPYMLVAMVAAGLAGAVVNRFLLPEGESLDLVGDVPTTLPPLSTPDFSFGTLKQLAPAAMAVTLFALAEAVSIARSLAARTGDLIDGNQEFVGQGLSNICGAFFSSYVATGSFNRSAVNYEAGAKTPVSAIVAGGLLMAALPLVAPALAFLPIAGLAAILFLVAWGLIDLHHIRQIVRASRGDSAVLWTTFAATLLLELDFAILLGVMLSLVMYLRRASQPAVRVRVPDPRLPKRRFNTDSTLPECPQFKIIRIDGPIFFGAVNYVAERLRVIWKRNPEQKHLLILARAVSFIDVAGAEMLAREAEQRKAVGGGLYFHQLPDGARQILERGGYMDEIGEENMLPTKGDAISAVFEKLDRDICMHCDRRIFNECKLLPRAEQEAATEPATAKSGDTTTPAGIAVP